MVQEDRRRQQEEQAKLYGRVVARAWQDEDFKRRLLEDAEGALAEMGVEVPPGHEVRAVEDTERVSHLVIPLSPGEELSEEQLDQVAGGWERDWNGIVDKWPPTPYAQGSCRCYPV